MVKITLQVSCFAYEGIEAIKEALIVGKKFSTEEMPIKVTSCSVKQLFFVATTSSCLKQRWFWIDSNNQFPLFDWTCFKSNFLDRKSKQFKKSISDNIKLFFGYSSDMYALQEVWIP